MNKVKVVFWDLDDTLWQGTLAEKDDVQLNVNRIEIVKTLNRRGIVNSICSKNDYDTTKDKMTRLGIWDLFVFNQISFEPKGELIRQALSAMHLRAENALFIDDNDLNLREVEFYNPQISTLNAKYADGILDNEFLQGKDDSQLTRFYQYKQLETKVSCSKKFSSNEDFLRNSNIQIKFITDIEKYFDRLYELVERTNQLNFTKNRMSKDELRELIVDNSVSTKLINVSDNYGDYGIVGFYSIKDKKLIHFVFSCRIMNMGVEQFVYQLLGFPQIDVVGDVASSLQNEQLVDWVHLEDFNLNTENIEEYSIDNILSPESKIKIYGLGACDLYHPIAYFSMPNQEFVYECNVFKGKERGVNVGTEYIRSQYEMDDTQKQYCKKHFFNYTGHLAFNSRIMDDEYDYVILSFHDDMIFKIYQHKEDKNIRVVLSPSRKYGDTSIINLEKANATYDEQRTWLQTNFDEIGYISKERFIDNIQWLLDKLPKKTKLILINGPELDFFRTKNPHDEEVYKQILLINDALSTLAKRYSDRIALVDINKVILNRDSVTDYVFHLKAQTAYNLFVEIVWAIVKNFPSKKPSMLHKVLQGRKVVIFGNNSEARNAFYNLKLGGESPIKYVHFEWENKKIGTMKVENCDIVLSNNRDEYFVVIADSSNQDKIIQKLKLMDYRPLVDFVNLKPIKYEKCWNEEK